MEGGSHSHPKAPMATPPKVHQSPLRLLILTPAPQSQDRPLTNQPSLLGPLLHSLTGEAPAPSHDQGGEGNEGGGFAGYTSHPPLKLRTKYYEVDVGIWCDELPYPQPAPVSRKFNARQSDSHDGEEMEVSLELWKEQMCSEAAREVRSVIGGILVVFEFERRMGGKRADDHLTERDEGIKEVSEEFQRCFEFLDAVEELRNVIEDDALEADIPLVVLLQARNSQSSPAATRHDVESATERMGDEWMDARAAMGWEFVGWDGLREEERDISGNALQERNDYGEKYGIARVLECLELANWNKSPHVEHGEAPGDILGDSDQEFHGLATGEDGIKLQSHEFEREMMGLKFAMREHEQESGSDEEPAEESQVNQLPRLMERAVAIREAAVEMSKEERERFAKREVEKLMRDMG